MDTDIVYENGIKVRRGGKAVFLDPKRKMPNSIVSHGHTDHLSKDAVMTHPTKDIMKVRKNWDASFSIGYNQSLKLDDFDILFRDAGHVLGSAMVRVDDLLYTGDFNPEGGLTCGKAAPEKCSVLVVEATYGQRRYSLPPKEDVVTDMLAWVGSEMDENSVIIGGYEFGKAQELVALCNKEFGKEVCVPPSIARICDIYLKHGIDLKYRILGEKWFEEKCEPRLVVIPPGWLMYKGQNFWQVYKERKRGTKTCFVSGWCAFRPRSGMDLDSEFPLSDHADFEDILQFVARCSPKKVYTVNGSTEELAREIKTETGIDAEPLN